MATYQETWIAKGVVKATWTLANGETGAAMQAPSLADKTIRVAVTGTAGTLTVKDAAGNLLEDTEGADLSFTAAGTKAIAQNPASLVPAVTGGDGTTAWTVEVIATTDR